MYLDFLDLEKLEKILASTIEIKMVFVETPSNPSLNVSDI
jgi:cystathionine beta-lyase/cystathionine gamma-synthase